MSKLQFRRLQQSDLETLRRWRMHPEVTKYLFSDPVLTPQDQAQWFRLLQQKPISKYWILTFYDTDIGYAALANIDPISKIAHPRVYICEVGYRRKGFGKYTLATLQKLAFSHYHMNKLCAQVISQNHPALFCFLKSGWKIEGLLREHFFKSKFYDVYHLALLKQDWLK